MTFIDILIWSFRMKMGGNCMSLSNSILLEADVGKASRGEHESGRRARGSWLRREREKQTRTLYLLSTSAFKPDTLPETLLRETAGAVSSAASHLG